MSDVRHVVQYSGGACSWGAAKRAVAKYGAASVTLLFADTNMEDEDLYRFLDEGAANIGVPITRIADGRTPWEVMRDEKIIANSRIDPCSKILKRQLLNKWMADNCDPESAVIHIGLDWTEGSRLANFVERSLPWKVEALMAEPPYLTKKQLLAWMQSEGIKPPRLYDLGFPHNNCGGFCVKAGQAQFALLLRTMPERYRWHEDQEEKMREQLGDYAVMKHVVNGASKPLPMRQFRERIERQTDLFDKQDWGGCGCAIE